MKWIQIDKNNDEQKFYAQLTNEAMQEFKCSLISTNVVTEADNKMVNWAMDKVKKICPTPDKIKDFFAKFGAKIDKSMQNAKSDTLKKVWQKLKDMVSGMDAKQVQQTAEENNKQDDGEYTKEQKNEVLKLWKQAMKDASAAKIARDFKIPERTVRTWIKNAKNKEGGGDNPSTQQLDQKNDANLQNPDSVENPDSGDSVKNPDSGENPDSGNKKNGTSAKQLILDFLKKHWKTILFILVICLAISFGGWFLAGKLAANKLAGQAIGDFLKSTSSFKLPAGMKSLPKGATLIGNGVVKYSDGSVLAMASGGIDTDF